MLQRVLVAAALALEPLGRQVKALARAALAQRLRPIPVHFCAVELQHVLSRAALQRVVLMASSTTTLSHFYLYSF